jgi:hypothetical protein
VGDHLGHAQKAEATSAERMPENSQRAGGAVMAEYCKECVRLAEKLAEANQIIEDLRQEIDDLGYELANATEDTDDH